jgi:hypothetical protein
MDDKTRLCTTSEVGCSAHKKNMLALLLLSQILLTYCSPIPLLHHEWKSLDYDWISPDQKEQYLADGRFIPENNALTGLLHFTTF